MFQPTTNCETETEKKGGEGGGKRERGGGKVTDTKSVKRRDRQRETTGEGRRQTDKRTDAHMRRRRKLFRT